MQTFVKYRWIIVLLLFFATAINYVDRQVIGLLKDSLSTELSWSEIDYSRIVMIFTAAYAIGLFLFGRIVDYIGTRSGYRVSIVVWSLAAIGHGFVRTTTGFGTMRMMLGFGEGGNFPAAIKTVAEWFSNKERAFATGIFNSGANAAAMIGPFLVMWLYNSFGWRETFMVTGALGFIWLVAWEIFYKKPPVPTKSDIHADAGKVVRERSSLSDLLKSRKCWTFAAGKFLSDPIWWFYLFWIPSYFNVRFQIDLTRSWQYVSVIYFIASFGSIAGGYLPVWMIQKGFTVQSARKKSMLIFAVCAVPIVLVRLTADPWVTVGLISLAAGAHQAWSANLFTMTSDMFGHEDVSSVVGIGGMIGSIGSVVFPYFIGIVLDHFSFQGQIASGYNLIFVLCGASYLGAWLLMHFLHPKQNDNREVR